MALKNFLQIMDVLLGENGCPWDKEQTHESLRKHMIEECYEAVDAVDSGDMNALCEELGDVLLQVAFHAKLAEKAGAFTMDDIIERVSQKIVSRHTHIFGDDKAASGDEAIKIWEANKAKEGKKTPVASMQAVPKALPALMRASKVLKRSNIEPPKEQEIKQEMREKIGKNLIQFEEYGKILLALVSLGNILGINAEFSLTNAIEEFINENSE